MEQCSMIGRHIRYKVLCALAAVNFYGVAKQQNTAIPVADTSIVSLSKPDSSRSEIPDLNKLVVHASRKQPVYSAAAQPAAVFSAEEITRAAGAAEDVSRYIASLPQVVASLGENFDNALYVRGGRPSEVVFMVDGIEFENVNHFSRANSSGGPVGFINSDFVKNVSFFAGNAPASYPSRLSSVIDVTMKAGSFTRLRHSLSAKLTGGMFSTEGPLGGGNASYAAAGRYVDFSPLRRFIGDRGIPRLGDCYFKGVLAANEQWDVAVTGLGSYNRFDFDYPVVEADDINGVVHENTVQERQRIIQGGAGITGRLRSGSLSNTTTLACSFRRGEDHDSLHDFRNPFFSGRYNENPVRREEDGRIRSALTSVGTWMPDAHRTVTVGARAGYQRYRLFTGDYQFHYGNYVVCTGAGPVEVEWSRLPRIRTLTLEAAEAGGHLEYAARHGVFESSVGIRSDYYGLLKKYAFSPKGTIGFDWGRWGKVRGSGGLQHQFPTDMPSLFFYYFSFDTTMDDATAARRTGSFLQQLEPLRCWQASVDYECRPVPWARLQTGVYFKWYDREYHYVSPKMQEVITFNDVVEPVLAKQNGLRKSYGAELMLGGGGDGILTWSAGGSLFDVRNRYSNGKWYDDWTNVRYTGSFSLGVRLFDHHQLSASARMNGGRPYCSEVIVADCIGRKSPVFEVGEGYYTKRFDRLFATHMRYSFEYRIRRLTTEWFVEVINLFNSQPVLEYRFNGATMQEVKPFGLVPIFGGKITW
jgi:hypothetical protein